MKFYFLFMWLGLLSWTASGQRMVSGTVTDQENGDALIGASVVIPGTTTGTITDIMGHFELEVPDDVNHLLLSFVGYQDYRLDLTSSDVYEIAMTSGQLLSEVVVIGYGSVERKDVTGALQTLSTEDFNKGAIASPQELLAGKVPGVQINTDGGAPGGGSRIRIRGGSSLSASNDPLIIIDGVPIANGEFSGSRNPLNTINPNDIETFTVLKDASATAIYGSRASNGVILITTKKGNLSQKLRVGYSGNFSISSPDDRVSVMGADEYRSLVTERYGEGSVQVGLLGDANTDWQDEIFQQAFGHEHNLNFSGGIANVLPYRVSVGYSDREGVVKTDRFNRITTMVNLNPSLLNDHLKLDLRFKGSFVKNDFADANAAIGNAIRFDPTQPVRNGSEFGGYTTWLQSSNSGDPITIATTNPVARLNQRSNESDANRYIWNAQADYRLPFFPQLRANLNVALDKYKGEGHVDVSTDAAFEFVRSAEGQLVGGRLEDYSQERENRLLEFYLNYKTDLSNSVNLDLMGGYSWQHFWRENFFAATRKGDQSIVLNEPDFTTLEYYLVSLFGRANLSFNDVVLLTGTLRRDGTSRFSEDNRWGLFPSVALAVKALDRDNSAGLSSLKFRAGWGVTGQQDINDNDYYPYLARYQGSQDNAAYQFGDEFIRTLRPNGYDANIKWEETKTINLGIDYGFFNDRLYGSLDLYHRKTTDLINFIPVPVGTNLTNFINTNIGDLENQGVEFSINAIPTQTPKLTWHVGFNVTSNRNEITKLTAAEDPSYLGVLTGGISGGTGNNIQIHSVGYAANSFFVFEQAYDEAGNPLEGAYVDRNGDGVINSSDQYRYENPNPDVAFGFNTRLDIGRWNLSTSLRAQVGNYVYNNIQSEMAILTRIYNSANYLENLHTDAPIINFENARYFSDLYVHNASFLRMDFVTLGYDFSDLLGVNCNLSLSVQNPFVITKYEGIDPEIASGIDNNFYPRPRVYSLGVNLDF